MDRKDTGQNRFYVDGRPYHTALATLTGAELRALVGVPLASDLLLRGEGDNPDKLILDSGIVNLTNEPDFNTNPRKS